MGALCFVSFPGVSPFFPWLPGLCQRKVIYSMQTREVRRAPLGAVNWHFCQRCSHIWKALKTNQGVWHGGHLPSKPSTSRRIVTVRNIIFLSKAQEVALYIGKHKSWWYEFCRRTGIASSSWARK